jgi:hypothetical protein
LSKHFKPLSGTNLYELNDSLLFSDSVRESSMFLCFSQIENGLAKSLYGLGHCAQDLLYFIPFPEHFKSNSVTIDVDRIESSTSSDLKSSITINYNGSSEQILVPTDDSLYDSGLHLSNLPDVYSAMKYTSYKTFILDKFGVNFKTLNCDVVHSVSSENSMVALATIDSKSSESIKTHRFTKVSATIPSRNYSMDNNKALIDSIIALVKYSIINHSSKFNGDRKLLATYVYSCICLHIKNVGRFESTASIEKLKIRLRIDFDQSHANLTIKDAVDSNCFMPISSLH